MAEDDQALRERIRSHADGVPIDLPPLLPIVRRARLRGWRTRVVAACVAVVLGGALIVSLRALLPLGSGKTGPAGGTRDTYLLSNFEVQYPYMGPGGDWPEDPTKAGVLFAAQWSGTDFPGEAQCTLHVFDAGGRELGSLPFGLQNLVPVVPVWDAHALAVPVEGGTPTSASGSCGPGVKPTGDYVFTNLRVEDGRVVVDVSWGGGRPPGEAWCVLTFRLISGEIRTERFTLGAPEGEVDLGRPALPGWTPIGIECEPFTGQPPQGG